MWESEVSHFERLLAEVCPKSADIHRRLPFDVIAFDINWPLGNDPDRPNKRSRSLFVIFSREFMEDYAARDPTERASERKRVMTWLNGNMKGFNPDHDSPKSVPPPRETWTI